MRPVRTIGIISPSYHSLSLVDFIKLLPDDIGVIPLYVGLTGGNTVEEYLAALDIYRQHIAQLARIGVDVIHPEGAPPFMLLGYEGEQRLIAEWTAEHKLPVFTSGVSQAAALRALGATRIVGVRYHSGAINDNFIRYFRDAGFDFLAMEGLDPPRGQSGTVTPEVVRSQIAQAYRKHPTAEAVHLLGESMWRLRDVIPLEAELGVPVLHPVAARLWYLQTCLGLREPANGLGQLLERMPVRA